MKVGDKIQAPNAGWSFGADVPETFVSHVSRSVPLYEQGHSLICQLSDFFCDDGSVCYELGVSTGELLRKLAEHNQAKPDARWIGLDVEAKMVARASEHCAGIRSIEVLNEDIRLYPYKPCDMIVSYYCIQFVPARDRQALFDRIYESLNWGGAFILFEKVRAPDARFQDLMVALYNDYKLAQGFTPDEIMSKSRSLKGVLDPFSTEGNLGLIKRAGFVDVMTILKYVCFEGFLAIK